MNYDSDQAIMARTASGGGELRFPGDLMPNGLPVVMTGVTTVNGPLVTGWCSSIRRERERQIEQRATEASQKGAAQRAAERPVGATGEPAGGGDSVERAVQGAEETMEEYVQRRFVYACKHKVELQRAHERKEEEIDLILLHMEELAEEIEKLTKMCEVMGIGQANKEEASEAVPDDTEREGNPSVEGVDEEGTI